MDVSSPFIPGYSDEKDKEKKLFKHRCFAKYALTQFMAVEGREERLMNTIRCFDESMRSIVMSRILLQWKEDIDSRQKKN